MRPMVHRLALRPPPERPAGVRQIFLFGLVPVLTLAAWIAWWQATREATPGTAAGRPVACGLGHFAAGTHVAVVGAASGGGGSAFALSGRHAARTGEVELLVTARTMPVHLVLVGHDPTIWRLGLAPGVRLAGVVVLAPRPQVVAGVPDGVAVRRLIGPGTAAACRLTLADLSGGGRRGLEALGREPDSVLVAGQHILVGPTPTAAAARARLATDAAVAQLVPRVGGPDGPGAR